MRNIQLSDNQYNVLYKALSFYYNHLSQPNEMAIDTTESRNQVYKLIEQVEQSNSSTTKRYRMNNGHWELIQEHDDKTH